MLLVKYLSQYYGVKSIISGQFKLVRPLDVNDPYEMMGTCVGQPRDKVRAEIRNYLLYEWARSVLDFPPRGRIAPLEDVKRSVDNIAYYIQRILMERPVQQRMDRIMCFIDANKINETSDQLMWGHYAKNGSGMRIWFDSDALSVAGMPPIFPIEYDSKRPALDLSELKSFDDHDVWDPFIRKLWLTKSCAWEYEHEWRMLIPNEVTKGLIVERGGLEFIKIPIYSIVRVDFGPKGFLGESKAIVRRWRNDKRTKHIDFRIATFSEDGYNYDYMDYLVSD